MLFKVLAVLVAFTVRKLYKLPQPLDLVEECGDVSNSITG
jgi:hypothetical protein